MNGKGGIKCSMFTVTTIELSLLLPLQLFFNFSPAARIDGLGELEQHMIRQTQVSCRDSVLLLEQYPVADAIACSLIDKEIVYPWRRPPKDPMGPDYESFLHRTYRENLHFTYCGDLLLSLKYRSILLLLSDHQMKSKTRLILINANQDEILSRVFLIPDLETSTITVDPGNYLFHIETTEEDRFVIEKALQTLLINPVSGQFSEVYVPRITKTRKEKTKRVWMPLKESPPDEDPIIID